MRPGQLHVAIIGAGATGTELSAELHRTVRGVVAYGLDHIDPDKDIKITLIEAADRILPALPERIATATEEILRKLNVDVKAKSRVTRVTADGVELATGEFIPSELVVWAAGVKGPDVLSNLDGLEVSRSNQLIVKPTLQTTKDDNIFAMGDCAYFVPAGDTKPVPPRAQAAHQEASHVFKQIKAVLDGTPADAVRLSRLRIAGVSRALFDGGQPHGIHFWEKSHNRGLVRQGDVPLALQDASDGAVWAAQGCARYGGAGADAPDRAAGQTALGARAAVGGLPMGSTTLAQQTGCRRSLKDYNQSTFSSFTTKAA